MFKQTIVTDDCVRMHRAGSLLHRSFDGNPGNERLPKKLSICLDSYPMLDFTTAFH